MAEIRQFAHSGREIDEAVEAVENSSAGLEIIDGELTLANIPDVSLGTITDTDLQEWLAKGLPIKVDYAFYSPSSITSTVVQYGHVGYAKVLEPSTHYLITYQYLQYTKATHSLALERSETISAEQLTAGVGIDVTNNEISLAAIPIITLNTVLSDDLVAWVEKGYPVKYRGIDNIEVYQQIGIISDYIVYGICAITGTANGYPILVTNALTYSKQAKMFVFYETNTITSATATTGGFIKLGDGGAQTVPANVASSTPQRTYPIQLDGEGRAVVNVPWEIVTPRYLHQVQFEVTEATFGTIHVNINFVLVTDTALTAADIAPLISLTSYPNPNKYPCSGVVVANDNTISYIVGINAFGTAATVNARPTIPISTTFNVANADNVTDVVTPL